MNARRAKAVDVREDAASDEQQDALGLGYPALADMDAEGVVLSACLMGSDSALDAVLKAGLHARHFYSTANQAVFAAILAVRAKPAPVNELSVAGWLRDTKTMPAEGVKYLSQLVTCTPATVKPELFAAEVVEKWRLRELITAMQRCAVRMRHGQLSHEQAREQLKAHFLEMKR